MININGQDIEHIAVDFDGTLCSDEFPEIGRPNTYLISLLKRLKADYGVKLILWTNREGELLEKAVKACEGWGITFDAVNANLPERMAKYGNDCRKVGADLYIDDKAITPSDFLFSNITWDVKDSFTTLPDTNDTGGASVDLNTQKAPTVTYDEDELPEGVMMGEPFNDI